MFSPNNNFQAFKKCKKPCLRLLTVIAVLACQPGLALELPFTDKNLPFEVIAQKAEVKQQHEPLFKLLTEGLEKQREDDIVLKQFSDPAMISSYEQSILKRMLKSQGYYRHQITAQIVDADTLKPLKSDEQQQNSKSDKKIKLLYLISPGTQYRVSSLQFQLPEAVDTSKIPLLALQENAPLKAEDLLSAQTRLRKFIQEQYCFYKVDLDYQVMLDHTHASAEVVFSMRPSEQTQFGKVSFKNVESIDTDYLKTFISYQEGDCFNRSKIDTSRFNLFRTNLISNVSIHESGLASGMIDTRYEISERNHRTLKAGIGYSTDEQFFVSAGWEHRNILDKGQSLHVNTRLSAIRQKVFSEFIVPQFSAEDNTLTLYSEGLNEELDTYEAFSLRAGIRMDYRVKERFSYSLGVELKRSAVKDIDDESRENFHLVSFPLEFQWDQTNDILDPLRGFLVTGSLEPFIDLENEDTRFVKSNLSFSAYHTFDVALQPTLAARYSLGTISGASLETIPADERFYVGGGGSVRGYPYQSLSLIEDDDPQGGLSFQEINTELRLRFLESWGLASFIGGGFAYQKSLPEIERKMLWAAGLGLRYYTAFAPFRLDIAFPLNKRRDYDDNFQLYISIGQAF